MNIRLEVATAGDAAELVELRDAVNQRFLSQFGKGYWIANTTERGVLFRMRRGTVFVARDCGKLIASLTLSTRKPWAIDTKYFSASKRPIYLTGMEVIPGVQGKGIGRQCLDEACRIAREWPADAIRLDAYAETAGAGEFYRKCGFREVGRATYRKAPLIYFEMLIR
jgi:ribosomal protein S18 acetylase RimI-like enzyme